MTDQQGAEIGKKAQLILSQCKPNTGLYNFSSMGLNVQQVGTDFSKGAQVEGIGSLQFYKLQNEQVELLRALYQASDDDGRKTVLDVSAKALAYPKYSAQAFAFLARYDLFHNTVRLLTATPDFFLHVAPMTLPALAQILRFDHSFIATEELEALCPLLTEVLRKIKPKGTLEKRGPRHVIHYSIDESSLLKRFEPVEKLVKYVCDQANQIQYLRLKKELRESANFEINQDRDRLLDSLASLGFSARLTEFLKFAEAEFSRAQDAFTYKTCVDQIRSFFAELLNETAAKIAASRGETLASAKVDTKYPVQVRQYLQSAGFFSEQFRTLVDGIYKFMSDEGTHTLGATRDVARIARNIAVEIGLLITKRLQQPKATTAP
jgi:hypothetical protein